MNPYPHPYGMPPAPPYQMSMPMPMSMSMPMPMPMPMPMMPGGVVMPPRPGTAVMSAPPMLHPGIMPTGMTMPNGMPMPTGIPIPYVPPNWQQRIAASPETQPMTLYLGKIPPEVDNDFIVQILEACGPVQKWNRPEDLAARTLKPFGFVTYTLGTSALRCRNVIHGLQICGGTLVIKAGTKEQTALLNIAESERHPPPTIDPVTRFPGPQQEVDTEALYDAPLRELIHKLIEKRFSPNPSEDLDLEIASLQAKTKAFTRQGVEEEDESTFDRERQILREIEKFRERQAKRDRELEQKRNERILSKLRELEDQQKNGAVIQKKPEFLKLAPSTHPENQHLPASKEREGPPPPLVTPTGHKRENENDEDQEAKRRRRLEALAMVNGEEVDYSLSAPPPSSSPHSHNENIPAPTSSSSEYNYDREQSIGNSVSSMSNKAIGGKLILKNNLKPTKRTAGFQGDEDESNEKNSRPIIPIDYTEEENNSLHYTHEQIAAQFLQKMEKTATASSAHAPAPPSSSSSSTNIANAENEAAKKKKLKEIVDTLPITREGLFSYPIDWKTCEKYNVIESSMRGWIGKKFMEYLGEEESSLTSFILRKISNRCHPDELMSELEPVLDKDTESFVLKLWRMLIFNVIKADIDTGGDGQGGR